MAKNQTQPTRIPNIDGGASKLLLPQCVTRPKSLLYKLKQTRQTANLSNNKNERPNLQEKLKTQRIIYKPFDGKIRSNTSNGKSAKIAQNTTKPCSNVKKSKSQDSSSNETNKSNDLNKSLTRSDTFVCDTTNRNSPETLQAANVAISSTTKKFIEKTSKRSLSPVLYDTLNLPKRKNLNIPSNLVRVLKYDNSNGLGMENAIVKENGSTLNITPIARNQHDTFGVSSAIKSSTTNSTFGVDNNDTTQILHSTMHNNRLIDAPKLATLNVVHQVQSTENKLLVLGETGNKTFLHENTTNFDNDHNNDQTMKTIQESQENESEATKYGGAMANIVDQVSTDKRSSLYLDLTECTLDCSIELCESSMTSSIIPTSSPSLNFKRQNSFEKDESLGILTPDQMKEFLDSNAGTSYLDLSANFVGNPPVLTNTHVDQTPSPEELPLDPVFIKVTESTQAAPLETGAKVDPLVKSTDLKLSNSFITSITSIGSLDNGYQGDGEMSRPASRGGTNSPYNLRQKTTKNKALALNQEKNADMNNPADIPIVRRQDQMTDSDFFTESDADDVFHRGDRRVQIIDGHLYNRQGQAADVFIDDQENIEDSNMDSSGIFTDGENRTEDNPIENECDTSAGSTDTIKSTSANYHTDETITPASDHTVEHQPKSKISSPIQDLDQSKSTNEETKTNGNSDKLSNSKPNDSPKTAANRSFSNLKLKKSVPSHKQNKNEVNVALRKHEKTKRDFTVQSDRKKPKTSPAMEKLASKISAKSHSKDENDRKNIFKVPAQKTAITKTSVAKKASPGPKANLKASSLSEIKMKSVESASRVSQSPSTGQSSPDIKKMSIRSSTQGALKRVLKKDKEVNLPKSLSNIIPPKSKSVQQLSKNVVHTPSPFTSFSKVGNLSKNTCKTSTPCSSSTSLSRTSVTEQNRQKRNKTIGKNNIISVITVDEQTSTNDIEPTKEVEALGVLIQHLVFNLDAFSVPTLRKKCEIANNRLAESQVNLENMRTRCHQLEQQIADKENIFTQKEVEREEKHKRELGKVEANLLGIKLSSEDRIGKLETILKQSKEEHENVQKKNQQEVDQKIENLNVQLKEARNKENQLQERIDELTSTENELREKITVKEKEFSRKLEETDLRERILNDKIKQLISQLNEAKCKIKENELDLLRDNISLPRHNNQNSSNNSHVSNNVSSCADISCSPQMLQDEVESLRCVLELKQSEIAELRKDNQELRNVYDELTKEHIKVCGLETRLEDLEIQLKNKIENENELIKKNRTLQESYYQEMKNRSRLTLHNEELQWKLKQNSEKFASTLNELSKSYQSQTNSFTEGKKSFCGPETQQSQLPSTSGTDENGESNDLSYPNSPVMKGVVEKSDSVSWVLELNDDESPEHLATRMVRRNSSFRCGSSDKSTPFKRCMSDSNSSSHQVSALATPIRRSINHGKIDGQMKKSRTRSQSLTADANAQPKDVIRSVSGTVISESSAWEQPLSSSSPYVKRQEAKVTLRRSNPVDRCENLINKSLNTRGRSNSIPADIKYLTNDGQADASKELKRNSKRVFPAVQSLQRPDMSSSSYSHTPAQKLKKCQEIKESAGEAMLSGNNSENESFSCSDSDSESLSSVSSDIISPTHYRLNRHYSIEEALMNKIAISLGSTPMEVSWAEDVDNDSYAHESNA